MSLLNDIEPLKQAGLEDLKAAADAKKKSDDEATLLAKSKK